MQAAITVRLTADMAVAGMPAAPLCKGSVWDAYARDDGRECYYAVCDLGILVIPFVAAEEIHG